jgi:hypothetical protein
MKLLFLIKKIIFSPGAFLKYIAHYIKLYRYNDLLQFANEEMTDKGVPGHNYARIYDFFLRGRRDSISYLCEIGLLRRSLQRQSPKSVYPTAPSLRMWRKYFPEACLVGFDIEKFDDSIDGKRTTIQGDQGSRSDLKKIVDHHDSYDVIIDDALHASPHQQITLSFLFEYLKPGGLYFIEDLKSQPHGFEKDDVPKTLDILRDFADTGIWSSPVSSPEEKKLLEQQVKNVYFFESLKGSDPVWGADAIVVLVKK